MKTVCQTIAALVVVLCASLQTVHAQTYQFDFIPTQSEIYPLSDYYGSYIDLSGPTGSNVDFPNALVGYNFVTPQGTYTPANSFDGYEFGGPPIGITWDINANQISFSGGAYYYLYGSSDFLVPGSAIGVVYEISQNNYQEDNIYGTWQAVTPTPEPSVYALLFVGIACLFFCRRRFAPFCG